MRADALHRFDDVRHGVRPPRRDEVHARAVSHVLAGLEIVDDHELLRPQAELPLDLVDGPRRGLAPLGV